MANFKVFALIFIASFAFVKAEPIIARIDDTTYLIWHQDKLVWKDALKFCAAKDMKLLSLQTKEKSEKLNQFLLKMGFVDTPKPGAEYIYWTSGNDRKKEGDFYWETTGEKVGYTNWLPTMPDNWRKDEHCIEMGYRELGKWNDNRCEYHRHFICERQVDDVGDGPVA